MNNKEININNFKFDKYYSVVCRAFGEILSLKNEVKATDVFMNIGLLSKEDYHNWKMGKYEYLESKIIGNLSKLERILKIIQMHAHDLCLAKSHEEIMYNKKALQYSKTCNPRIEDYYKAKYAIIGNKDKFIINKKELLEIGKKQKDC
jgi:hypothetical protein